MKRLLLILLLPPCLLLLSGCGSLFKQQWYDFTAYYNTFYNAKQHFRAGVAADRAHRPPLNPHQLISIHPSPSAAGATDFNRAIEKSSSILRNHRRSSYIDDALEMVGVSWFYLQEYFAAREKFRELYRTTDDPAKRELAVIWEGRTWLELGLAADGVRFMEEEIERLEAWDSGRRAEAQTVLAQLYAHQGHHFMAANLLLASMNHLEEGDLRTRAWFHYGQVMDRLDNPDQAIRAFSEIPSMQPAFDLEFYSRLKEVEIWRRSGHPGEADIRLNRMLRDDRFYTHYPEMQMESAAILLAEGDPEAASELYLEVIEESDRVTPEQIARCYYQLAELNRTVHGDLITAAHYYEEAASIPVDSDWMPESWDASQKAQEFGTYAAARQRLDDLERLLALSELPQEELERKLAESGESGLLLPEEEVGHSLDVGTIPRSPAARDSVEAARIRGYFELGSLFYVTLAMPDSAAIYYTRVAESAGDGEILASAIYGLADLALQVPDSTRATTLSYRLIEQFPRSRQAELMIERLDLQPVEPDQGAWDLPNLQLQ